MNGRRTAVLLVDDHQVVRVGMRALLETVPHMVVVGEAGTAAGAVLEARRTYPDVVVMDVRLPDGSGVEACRDIRSERPATRVLMLTSFSDEEAVVSSILAGASGYLLKQAKPEALIEALETVARGGSLLDPGVTATVMGWMQRRDQPQASDPLRELTDLEQRMLYLIGEGKTNREIAGELAFSEHTVKAYVSRILHKLHLGRRSEAAAFIARRREACARQA